MVKDLARTMVMVVLFGALMLIVSLETTLMNIFNNEEILIVLPFGNTSCPWVLSYSYGKGFMSAFMNLKKFSDAYFHWLLAQTE